jgi:hypothetical protein
MDLLDEKLIAAGLTTPEEVANKKSNRCFYDDAGVTVTLLSGAGAKARQISAVPLWTLLRRTSAQVSPPPDTPVTVVLAPEM